MPRPEPTLRILLVETEGGSYEQALPDDDEVAWHLVCELAGVTPPALWQVRPPGA
jgi:hypothetical protein